MEYKSSEVKAGIFIFLGLLTFGVFLFTLGNLSYFKPERKTLRMVFNSSMGLEVGTTVRYSGLEVGEIKSIDFADSTNTKGDGKVMVVSEIDNNIVIKKTSTAMIKTEGLMGGFYVDIRPGMGSELLPPDGLLQGQDTFEFAKVGDMAADIVMEIKDFTKITSQLAVDAGETLKSIKATVVTVNNLLTENQDLIAVNLKNLSRVTGEFANVLETGSEDIQKSLKHVSSMAEVGDELFREKETSIKEIISETHDLTIALSKLLDDNAPKLTKLMDTFESESSPKLNKLMDTLEAETRKMSDSFESATVNFDSTFEQSDAILVENRRNLLELIRNMKETSTSLKLLTSDLQRNPWKLVRKGDEEEAKPPENKLVKVKDKHIRESRRDRIP